MRGGFLHNIVLLAPIADHFRRLGAAVHIERPVDTPTGTGSVDLFIQHGADRIVCEAELTARRIVGDFDKAAALRASWLLIVTPTIQVARSAERCVSTNRLRLSSGSYSIEPLGRAMSLVQHCFPIDFQSHSSPQTTNHKST